MSDDHSLSEISDLFDQVILLLGQVTYSCSYIRRLNILIRFFNDKNQAEIMFKENIAALAGTDDMLFGPKYKEFPAKSINLKNKSKCVVLGNE